MSDTGNGNTLTYRVAQLERDLERFEGRYEDRHRELVNKVNDVSQDLAVLRTEFKAFETNVIIRLKDIEGTFNDDVKGLRKVAIGAGSAVLIAAITFAISALKVFGGPG